MKQDELIIKLRAKLSNNTEWSDKDIKEWIDEGLSKLKGKIIAKHNERGYK